MTKLLFMLFVGLIGIKPTVIVKYNNTKKNTAYIDYNKTQKLKWTDFKIYNGKRHPLYKSRKHNFLNCKDNCNEHS